MFELVIRKFQILLLSLIDEIEILSKITFAINLKPWWLLSGALKPDWATCCGDLN
jgi:hypothetical protein